MGLRVARLLFETAPAHSRLWPALLGVVAVGAAAWLAVALLGIGALALWLRMQRVHL